MEINMLLSTKQNVFNVKHYQALLPPSPLLACPLPVQKLRAKHSTTTRIWADANHYKMHIKVKES